MVPGMSMGHDGSGQAPTEGTGQTRSGCVLGCVAPKAAAAAAAQSLVKAAAQISLGCLILGQNREFNELRLAFRQKKTEDPGDGKFWEVQFCADRKRGP